jgi:hypothetical protein
MLLLSLGLVHSFQGDYARSQALQAESLDLQRALGFKGGTAETLSSLGGALQCLGRHDEAAA